MTLRARQELVKTKSPAELASITSFSDIPVPSKIENLLKGTVLAHNYKERSSFCLYCIKSVS